MPSLKKTNRQRLINRLAERKTDRYIERQTDGKKDGWFFDSASG